MAPPASKARKTRAAIYTSVLVVSGMVSPIALGIALLLRWSASRSHDSENSWRGVFAFALLGVALYGLILWRFHPLVGLLLSVGLALRSLHIQALAWSLLLLWGGHGLLAPAISLILEGLVKSTPGVPLAPQPVLSRPGQGTSGQRMQVGAGSTPVPEQSDGEIVVGQALSGNLWSWVRGSDFVYPWEVLFHHAIAVAQSGRGKSELLRRIAYTLAKQRKMKVFWIDGKGDWKDAARFELAMRQVGYSQVGIFPVVQHAGWRGARQDVLNLLMTTQLFESDYYRGVTANILKLALYMPGLPAVSSGAELLRRIYPPTLLSFYESSQEGVYLEKLSTDALWGPYNRYQAFFGGVQDRLDGTRGYGDFDAAYYLLDEKRLQGEQLASFARYLIDDFYLYLALRQVEGKQRPILLVLDDFSSYSKLVPVHKLYERVRSSHGSVILSAQGYEGLGDDAERLLEDAATMILGKCNLPEKLIRVAGRKKVLAFSYHLPTEEEHTQHAGEEEQPRTIMREEERWLVEPDEVRRLDVGEVYFLYGTAFHKVGVERMKLDEDAVVARAAELLQAYEHLQADYETRQAHSLGSVPAGSQPSRKKKKRRPAPPLPPQPDGGGTGATSSVSSGSGSGGGWEASSGGGLGLPKPTPPGSGSDDAGPRPLPSLDDIE
jgi:hypothetical protein